MTRCFLRWEGIQTCDLLLLRRWHSIALSASRIKEVQHENDTKSMSELGPEQCMADDLRCPVAFLLQAR